jgi:hypothetical protein
VQKVIGYEGIQRFMPVNFVQAHQDLLYEAASKLEKNVPQTRWFQFHAYREGVRETVDFYPLKARGTLGFNFMIYEQRDARRKPWRLAYWASDFATYINQKQQELTNLMPPCRDDRPESTKLSKW